MCVGELRISGYSTCFQRRCIELNRSALFCYINCYYSTTLDQEGVSEEFKFEDLPDFWKNSNVDIITDEENEFSAEITFDEGGSVEIESKTVTIWELRESLFEEENTSANRVSLMGDNDIEEILVEFVKLINDLGKSYGKKR